MANAPERFTYTDPKTGSLNVNVFGNPNKYRITKDTPYGKGTHGEYKTRAEAQQAMKDDLARGHLAEHNRPQIEKNPHYNIPQLRRLAAQHAVRRISSGGPQPRDDHGRFASK